MLHIHHLSPSDIAGLVSKSELPLSPPTQHISERSCNSHIDINKGNSSSICSNSNSIINSNNIIAYTNKGDKIIMSDSAAYVANERNAMLMDEKQRMQTVQYHNNELQLQHRQQQQQQQQQPHMMMMLMKTDHKQQQQQQQQHQQQQEKKHKKIYKPRQAWTKEEDDICYQSIMQQINQNVPRIDWTSAQRALNGTRSAKQCRERWRLKLDPSLASQPWAKEEDDLLRELYNRYGSSWVEISKNLKTSNGLRSEHACKSRWRTISRAAEQGLQDQDIQSSSSSSYPFETKSLTSSTKAKYSSDTQKADQDKNVTTITIPTTTATKRKRRNDYDGSDEDYQEDDNIEEEGDDEQEDNNDDDNEHEYEKNDSTVGIAASPSSIHARKRRADSPIDRDTQNISRGDGASSSQSNNMTRPVASPIQDVTARNNLLNIQNQKLPSTTQYGIGEQPSYTAPAIMQQPHMPVHMPPGHILQQYMHFHHPANAVAAAYYPHHQNHFPYPHHQQQHHHALPYPGMQHHQQLPLAPLLMAPGRLPFPYHHQHYQIQQQQQQQQPSPPQVDRSIANGSSQQPQQQQQQHNVTKF